MKKKIAAILICSMSAALLLGGCGEAEDTAESVGELEEAEEAEEAEEEVISTETMLASTDYDVTAYVTLPEDYLDLTIELDSDYEVTEDEIEEYIDSYILAYYPDYTPTDKTVVEEGDIVNIDYVGTIDGEEFEGGSAEDYNLLIGSGAFIEGFEDGLIGQEVGTTVDVEVTFPEDYYSEDLAGQDSVFTVTINAIMEETYITYDELTDAYVAANFALYGMETVDDLIAETEETLESTNASAKQSEIQDKVMEKLLEESTFDYPEELLDERVESYVEEVTEGAEEESMTYEEYVLAYSNYDDLETFESEVRSLLEDYLKEELILEAMVADQGITITRSEFDSFVNTFVAYYGYESAEEFYDYYGGEEYVMLSYAENYALDDVIDAATIVLPE